MMRKDSGIVWSILSIGGSPTGTKFNETVDCILNYSERYNQQAEVAKMLLENGVGV
jgi:hypothetical protein